MANGKRIGRQARPIMRKHAVSSELNRHTVESVGATETITIGSKRGGVDARLDCVRIVYCRNGSAFRKQFAHYRALLHISTVPLGECDWESRWKTDKEGKSVDNGRYQTIALECVCSLPSLEALCALPCVESWEADCAVDTRKTQTNPDGSIRLTSGGDDRPQIQRREHQAALDRAHAKIARPVKLAAVPVASVPADWIGAYLDAGFTTDGKTLTLVRQASPSCAERVTAILPVHHVPIAKRD